MPKLEWKSPAIYPRGRAAEFALAAKERFKDTDGVDKVILEYVVENEHQSEDEFESLGEMLEDFALYLSVLQETDQESPPNAES